MTSRNFLEGKFLKPPDEVPRRPKEKVGRKPKPQRKQPKQQQQQQEQKQEQPPRPQPYRKPTLGELLQNPPRFPSPPAKGTPKKAKVQFVLPETEPKKKRRRRATLYDVIARRVGPHGFHKNQPRASKYRDTESSGQRTCAPEEVLFKRPVHWNNRLKGEPYLKADKLSPDNPTDREMKYPKNKFPDNDLLTALHAYASDKYIHTPGKVHRAFVSMDESALLAFGILMEELSKDAIDEKGDIPMLRAAVPEAEENKRIDGLEWWFRGKKRRRSDKLVRENYRVVVYGDRVRFIRTRKRKPKVKPNGEEGTEEGTDTDGQSIKADADASKPPKRPRSPTNPDETKRSKKRKTKE